MFTLKRAVIGIGLLASVAGGVAYANGGRLELLATLFFAHAPREPFVLAKAPPAPDYAKASSWAALPDRADASDVVPEGLAPSETNKAQADVFFIHPTSFFSSSMWNQPTEDASTNARTDSGSIRNQASVFNGCCRVYAPRYRQMTFGGFMTYSESSKDAMALAYSDVKRAFQYYLFHYNHGRPFIIAAHSQGSRHARTLIEEMIATTPLRHQMVAAYIVGNWIEAGWFNKTLKGAVEPCARADDTGCVLTWSTVLDGEDAAAQRVAFAKRSGLDPQSADQRFVCTNPLNWRTDSTAAPASLDRGGWVYGAGENPRAVDPGLVAARCDNGALYVSKPVPEIYNVRVLPGGNYHNYDYQLAWLNIRENAEERVKAFLLSAQSSRR